MPYSATDIGKRRRGAYSPLRGARVQLEVELFGDDECGAVFEGVYIVLPADPDGPLEEGGSGARIN